MLVIFCEECGGKNMVAPETLEKLEGSTIDCQICNSHISTETIVSYSGAKSKSAKSVNTKDIKLLFVDDDPLFLEIMHAAIKNEYSVHIALTGEQGLQLAAELIPDMIFLDINMPGMDGYEICTQLKNNPRLRHIPIIFISASATTDDEWKGLKIGAVDYMSKPIDPQIFHARVDVHIRLQKLLDAQQEKVDQSQETVQQLKGKAIQLEQRQEEFSFGMTALKNGLNEVNQMVALLDAEGKIRWANKKSTELLGLPLESILGHSCSKLFCESDEESAPCFASPSEGGTEFQSVEHFSSRLQCTLTHKHIPVFSDDGELLSQIHLAEINTSSHSDQHNQTPDIAKLLDIINTLRTVSHTVTDNKQFENYKTYVLESLAKFTELLKEFQPQTPS